MTVTGFLTGLFPASWKQGFMGYVVTAGAAVAAGGLARTVPFLRPYSTWITVGGLLIVGIQLLQQFFPGLNLCPSPGTGLITSSNFYVPQVNQNGSMASFILPGAIPVPTAVAPAGMSGLGSNRSMRRVGRLR
jgi:hypothetical protein